MGKYDVRNAYQVTDAIKGIRELELIEAELEKWSDEIRAEYKEKIAHLKAHQLKTTRAWRKAEEQAKNLRRQRDALRDAVEVWRDKGMLWRDEDLYRLDRAIEEAGRG